MKTIGIIGGGQLGLMIAEQARELGVRTVLGVSNISFGLPCRTYLNTTFLTMAMYAGLDLAIMNPSSEEMMAAVYAYNVLTNRDKQSTKYIERFADRVPASTALAQAAKAAPAASAAEAELTGPYAALMKAVEKGLKGDAAAHTRALLAEKQPLEVVDEALIPALSCSHWMMIGIGCGHEPRSGIAIISHPPRLWRGEGIPSSDRSVRRRIPWRPHARHR